MYTCPGHLSDAGFASWIGDSSDGAQGVRRLGLREDEVAKVKGKEERQKRKDEIAKVKEKDEEEDKASDSEPKHEPKHEPKRGPKHERYALHRDFFASKY